MAPTKTDLEGQVRGILAELFPDHDVGSLPADAEFADTLDMDSMALIDTVLEIERRTGVHIPDEDLDGLTTIDATVRYLAQRLDSP